MTTTIETKNKIATLAIPVAVGILGNERLCAELLKQCNNDCNQFEDAVSVGAIRIAVKIFNRAGEV